MRPGQHTADRTHLAPRSCEQHSRTGPELGTTAHLLSARTQGQALLGQGTRRSRCTTREPTKTTHHFVLPKAQHTARGYVRTLKNPARPTPVCLSEVTASGARVFGVDCTGMRFHTIEAPAASTTSVAASISSGPILCLQTTPCRHASTHAARRTTHSHVPISGNHCDLHMLGLLCKASG